LPNSKEEGALATDELDWILPIISQGTPLLLTGLRLNFSGMGIWLRNKKAQFPSVSLSSGNSRKYVMQNELLSNSSAGP
jgi:hypothetical protein